MLQRRNLRFNGIAPLLFEQGSPGGGKVLELAVLLDEIGEITSVDGLSSIEIYEGKKDAWQLKKAYAFSVNRYEGIMIMRQEIKDLIASLETCHHLVATKIEGIAYHVFEGEGFCLYEVKSENIKDALNDVYQEWKGEEKEKRIEKEEESLLKELVPHYYSLDLNAAQGRNREKSTKQILLPILEQGDFNTLVISCDHVPPWMENGLCKYQVEMESEKLEQGGYLITLLQKNRLSNLLVE